MTAQGNKIRYLALTKKVDFANDTFKICLMNSSFVWNRQTQFAYADISAYELGTANGYTALGAALSGVTITEDDTNNRVKVTWNNASWTATGGSIGTSAGAIIYDDTVSSPTAKPIVGYLDFGGGQLQVAGGVFTVAGIEFDWSD